MTLAELAKTHGFKPGGILHVGASMLEEAEQYRDMGVNTVYWIEALPASERRMARAKEFGHTLYEFTQFSDKIETGSLRVASNEVSSSILPFNRHSSLYPDIFVKDEIPIITVRADGFFGNTFPKEIDTLVLDVQGAELKVLKGLGALIDQIQWCWSEVNLKELYTDCALQPQLEAWLEGAGFVNKEIFPVHTDEWSEGLYRR